MNDVNWELIIFIIIVGLIVFAFLGIFIGTRISADKRRIRELEGELTAARKDLETYRTRVNDHFKKTSELFSRMTDSYKAVYVHMAEGAQSLCTNEASLLKPANSEFLKLAHGESGQDPEAVSPERRQTVNVPEQRGVQAGQPEIKAHAVPGGREPERPEVPAPAAAQSAPSAPAHEDQSDGAGKTEEKPERGQENPDSQAQQSAATQ